MPALTLIMCALLGAPFLAEELAKPEVRDVLWTVAALLAAVLVVHRGLSAAEAALEYAAYGRRAERLRAFAGSITRGEVDGRGAFSGGATVVRGELDGLPLRLTVRARGPLEGLLYELWAWHALVELDVTRPGLLERALATQRPGAPPSGRAAELDRAVARLLAQHGALRVSLRAGVLRVEAPLDERALDLERLKATFGALAALARLVTRREVDVRCVAAGRAFAWAGAGDRLRCPYCRDDLALAASDLAACDACRTVHHADCLAEAGGCTVLGCVGAPTPRERAAPAPRERAARAHEAARVGGRTPPGGWQRDGGAARARRGEAAK